VSRARRVSPTPVDVELWKTDGTAAGSLLVADLFPGSISATPMSLTAFNGKLLFNGFNGVNGTELTEDRACRTER
jgi:ELWxxDGT repeat protein